ncbi:hypothetical protein [Bradyrhizobium erythrophlei]|uniref:Peptidase family M41 n=1 Tax=Bradyrhizobium erythrophlei TaxID=1437360 RepID=A0A1M5GY37_9BRAD|nr:hypothetical protein [Bradyrhizobium erythrophlei]SHG08649.1 hypothetical protein SAMN05443248_0231 [Bradyrhizobium erythrophlei]
MTEGIPADEVPEHLAASPAGTVTAACVGVGNADNGGGHEEADDYDELLASLGRTEEHDQRVAVHELGHVFVNRLIGNCSISEVTINPGDGFDGLCRGAGRAAFGSGGAIGVDARVIREVLQPLMPPEGEDRRAKADVFQSVLDAVTELMAGEVAEKMLLDGEPTSSGDDRRQARELAALICKTGPATDRFILLCEQQAYDLLSPYVGVLMSMQIVLRIHRAMTGEEMDRAIATVVAGQALAVERLRRADWRKREVSANSFEAACDHVNGASMPHLAPDRVR